MKEGRDNMFHTVMMLRRMRDMLLYHNALNKIVKKATHIDELPTVYLDRAIKGLSIAYGFNSVLKYEYGKPDEFMEGIVHMEKDMDEERKLYNSAVESIKRYKESEEELMDFDEFMDKIEKEGI